MNNTQHTYAAQEIEELVARFTAYESFAAMVDDANVPTLRAVSGLRGERYSRRDLTTLADAYDRAQAERGSMKRAFRV